MIERNAVRALLLSEPENLLLLMKIFLPDIEEHLWIAPGGGIEAGEEPATSLVREIHEETGYTVENTVGPVWTRRHVFDFRGKSYDQRESFYLVRAPRFEPDHTQNPAETEQELFRQFRWWPLQQMKASDEIFVPRLLPTHIENLIKHGCPPAPIEVGA